LNVYEKILYRGKDDKEIREKVKRDEEELKKEIGGSDFRIERLEIIYIKELEFRH